MKASIYEIKNSQNNIPCLNCLADNLHFEDSKECLDWLRATIATVRAMFKKPDPNAVYLVCVDDDHVFIVRDGKIVASNSRI